MSHFRDLLVARFRTDTSPTQAQKEAGNYRKGIVRLHGLKIRVENPAGSIRKGISPDGKEWSSPMHNDYGYFMGTRAVDGDPVDCFVGPDLDSHHVTVIDQYKKDGSFDESKVVLGTKTREEAHELYLKHYPKGWKLGPSATTTTHQLKHWLRGRKTKAPFVGQKIVAMASRRPLIRFMATWDGSRDRIQGGEVVSPKLEGIYAKATKKGIFTKNGNEVRGQGLLKLRLKPHFLLHPHGDLEGELYRKGESFQDTVSDFKRGKRLPFNVFPGQKNVPLPVLGIKRVRSKVVKTQGEATTHYKQALADGYEGQIIQRPNGEKLKRKPHRDAEYRIEGVEKGKTHGIMTLRKGKKTFKVQAPTSLADKPPVGKKATLQYRRLTDGGIPYDAKFKHIRDFDMSTRSLTSRLIQMASQNRKPLNPALKAGATAAVAGGLLGAIPGLKNSSRLGGTLKSIGGTAAGLGGLVGGGTYVGNKILGHPRDDEGAPFTKRAALGGAILGGVVGAGGVLAAKKFKPAAKFIARHAEGAEGWRPARFIKNASLPAGVAAGTAVGAAAGADRAADEGQQVDVINSIQRNAAQRRVGGSYPRSSFSSRMKLIRLERLLNNDDGIPLNGKVAHDRFIKKIHNDDLDRRDANVGRAAGAGALAGLLAPVKRLKGMPGTRAAVGAALGGAAVLGIRRETQNRRDIYGDRTRNAKNAEKIPAIAGLGAAGVLAYKGIKKKFKLSSRQRMIVFGEGSRKFRDTAIGAGALAAGGGVAYAGIKAGKALGEHERLAKTAGDTATTVNAGVQKAARAYNRVSSFAQKAKALLSKKLFFSRGRLIRFDIDAREKGSGKFTNAYKELLNRSVRGGEVGDIDALNVAHAAHRISGRHSTHVMRAKRMARDLGLYQPKQGPRKEWEKPWAQKVAATAVIGAGLLGHVAAIRKFPKYKAFVQNRVSDVTNVKSHVEKMGREALGMNVEHSSPVITGKLKKLSSKLRPISFDEHAAYHGWDVRDPRGKSARIFAPGHQRRTRRPADWHETKDGQRKLLIGAGAVAALGAGALSYKIGHRGGFKKAILHEKLNREAVEKGNIIDIFPKKTTKPSVA